MKFNSLSVRAVCLSLVVIGVGAVETPWVLNPTDEFSQGLPDIDPLLGHAPKPLIFNDQINLKDGLDSQVQKELDELQIQARTLGTTPFQALKAGQAAWLLGLIHLHGAGVSVNSALANQWFVISASHGYKMAIAGLAWCFYDGCQKNPDFSQALEHARSLLSVDRARAEYIMWLIEEKLRPLQGWSEEKNKEISSIPSPLLRQAADGGDIHAMLELGIYWAQKKDYQRALAWFDRASPMSRAAKNNAKWVRTQISSGSPQAEGKVTLKPAPTADGLFLLARQFHRGDGVAMNYAEAIRLYRKADSAGSIKARKMLILIFSRVTTEGTIDLTWMRQLADMDIAAVVPKQLEVTEVTSLQREITPLLDLLPLTWRERMTWQSIN